LILGMYKLQRISRKR